MRSIGRNRPQGHDWGLGVWSGRCVLDRKKQHTLWRHKHDGLLKGKRGLITFRILKETALKVKIKYR